MRAAFYGRVSTVRQKTDSQVDDSRAMLTTLGWEWTEYLEQESAVKHRPVLERMMQDAKLGKFDVVVVWKLDRIARSTKQFIDIVLELDRYNVRFMSLTQKMIDSDQKDPMGRFLLHLFAALAELERGIIVERVRSGIAAAKSRGKHCGRPAKAFRRDLAVELRLEQKLSWREIARRLGVDQRTIRRVVAAAAAQKTAKTGVAKASRKSPQPVKQTKD
jgi:DNA invertase Pin-like site-specific DNA recombinase